MPDYRTMYDRDYIGHFDLPSGKDLTLTIKRVIGGELTAMGGRKSKKPIVHFSDDKVKPLICNKTNAKTIASMYGNMVEGWKGRSVTLFVSTTRDPSGGGEVECIRIRPKIPNASARSPVASEPQDLEETESAADAPIDAAPQSSTANTLAAAPSHEDAGQGDIAGAATYISDAELQAIEIVVEAKGIKGRFDTKLRASGIKSPDKIPARMFQSIKAWVEAAK